MRDKGITKTEIDLRLIYLKQMIMNSRFLKGLGILLLSGTLGYVTLILPINDKRITALIGLVLFAILGHFIFKYVKSLKRNILFILSLLWMLLFPIPYVITHPWNLTILLTLLACLMGVFVGSQTASVNPFKTKLIYAISVVAIFLLVNVGLYSYVFDFAISLGR